MISNPLAIEMVSRAIIIAQKSPLAKGCHSRKSDIEARDGREVWCQYRSVYARSFSGKGSVLRAAHEMGHSITSATDRNSALTEALGVVLAALEAMAWQRFACTLEDFNDREETTRKDVLDLLYALPVALPEEPYSPVTEVA